LGTPSKLCLGGFVRVRLEWFPSRIVYTANFAAAIFTSAMRAAA